MKKHLQKSTHHPQVAGGSSGTLILCCHRLEKRGTAGILRDRDQGWMNSRDSAPFPADWETWACPAEEAGGVAPNTGFQAHFSTLRGLSVKRGRSDRARSSVTSFHKRENQERGSCAHPQGRTTPSGHRQDLNPEP